MKKFLTVFLLCFIAVAVAWLVVNPREGASPAETLDPPEPMESIESATFQEPDTGPKTVAFYFHGDKRCKTCLQIEKSTYKVIEEDFASELESGDLALRSVNYEEKANAHFRDDFELTFGTVVVATYLDGEVQEYRNLEKVWELVWDDAAFKDYIEQNTLEMMGVETEE